MAPQGKTCPRQGGDAAQHQPGMGAGRLPEKDEGARGPGQLGAGGLQDAGKARQHEEQQEEDHGRAHQQQHGRVDAGRHQAGAQALHPGQVARMLGQGHAELAGALIGRHDGADQLVKGLGLGPHGGRERLALLHRGHHAIQRMAHAGLGFLLAQGAQGLQQGNAGIQQHGQLLAEKLQGKARTAAAPARSALGRLRVQLAHLQQVLGRHAGRGGHGLAVAGLHPARGRGPARGVEHTDQVLRHGEREAGGCAGAAVPLTNWSGRRPRPRRRGGRRGPGTAGRSHHARRASGTGSRCARGPWARPWTDRGRTSVAHRPAW